MNRPNAKAAFIKSNPRIGVFGHYGNENLGDEAIIAATISSIKRFVPEAEIYGFSVNPEDTKLKHGVDSYPIRFRKPQSDTGPDNATRAASQTKSRRQSIRQALKRIPLVYPILRVLVNGVRLFDNSLDELGFFFRSYNILKTMDLLIIAGSGQLNDEHGGVSGFPWTLFKWNLLAKFTGSRVAFVSVGAGPLESPASKQLIRLALKMSDYTSYRDTQSRELIKKIEGKFDHPVYPDLAFSHNLHRITARPRTQDGKRVFAINPLPYFDARYWPIADESRYRQFIDKIAKLATQIVANGDVVSFFSTQLKASPLVIADIMEKLRMNGSNIDHASIWNHPIGGLEDLMSEMNGADVILAARFHGILLSLSLGKPTVGLAYNPKTVQLMESMGVPSFCLDIDDFTPELAYQRMREALNSSSVIASLLRQRTERNRRELDIQYQAILAPYLSPSTIPGTGETQFQKSNQHSAG